MIGSSPPPTCPRRPQATTVRPSGDIGAPRCSAQSAIIKRMSTPSGGPWSRLMRWVEWNARDSRRARGGGVVRGWRYLKRWLRAETEQPPDA